MDKEASQKRKCRRIQGTQADEWAEASKSYEGMVVTGRKDWEGESVEGEVR